jgi:Tfp pilus assembly protein PilN
MSANGEQALAALIRLVPQAVWVFLVGQAVVFGIYLIRLDGRVETDHAEIASLRAQIAAMDASQRGCTTTLAQLTERMQGQFERMNMIQRQQHWIIQMLTPHPAPPAEPRRQ